MILSRYDSIPCTFDPYIQRLGNLQQMFASIPDLPFRFQLSRRALILSRPVKLEGLDDQVCETALHTLGCSAYMIYVPGELGALKLFAIRSMPDFPIISTDLMHISLTLANEVFSSGEIKTITNQLLSPSDQFLAMPIFTGSLPAGVFVLIPSQ